MLATGRLGVKRLRNELQRLHEPRLSPATIHKVLAQHDVSVLPTRKRVRHKPKRYERPVPGDWVQMGIHARSGLASTNSRRSMTVAASLWLAWLVAPADRRPILEEFWAVVDPKAADVGERSRCGFTTTTGTAHTSRCKGISPSIECVSEQTAL